MQIILIIVSILLTYIVSGQENSIIHSIKSQVNLRTYKQTLTE